MITILQRRGPLASVPAEADDGLALYGLNGTHAEQFIGQGPGQPVLPVLNEHGHSEYPEIRLPSGNLLSNPRQLVGLGQTNGSGEATITFPLTFQEGPIALVTAVATSGAHPTIAEVVGTSTTQMTVRTYRLRTQGVFLGGSIDPDERVQAFFSWMVIGQEANP